MSRISAAAALAAAVDAAMPRIPVFMAVAPTHPAPKGWDVAPGLDTAPVPTPATLPPDTVGNGVPAPVTAPALPVPAVGMRATLPDGPHKGTWQIIGIGDAVRFQRVSADGTRLIPRKTFSISPDELVSSGLVTYLVPASAAA